MAINRNYTDGFFYEFWRCFKWHWLTIGKGHDTPEVTGMCFLSPLLEEIILVRENELKSICMQYACCRQNKQLQNYLIPLKASKYFTYVPPV
jgi:hypothetical protein